jgi:hypothetical protein
MPKAALRKATLFLISFDVPSCFLLLPRNPSFASKLNSIGKVKFLIAI